MKYMRRLKDEVPIAYHRFVSQYLKGYPLKDRLTEYRERDPQENFDTTPPEDEFIDLVCLWAVEIYTPSHIDSLVDSFIGLGWDRDGDPGELPNPITWLEGLRRDHLGGAWLNLGLLGASNLKAFWRGPDHEVPLPPNVQYATAGLYSLTPSLVCMVVGFVFDNASAGMFDRALRTDHSTYATPTRRGWQFRGPLNQKSDHITKCRTELSNLAFDWFARHLPGLFSSGLLGGQLPTCELITTRLYEPFESLSEGENPVYGYRWILGLGRDIDAWKYKGAPNLRLRLPRGWEQEPRHHAVLAMRESLSEQCKANEASKQSVRDKLYELDQIVPNWLTVWAILPLLEGYTRQIREIRDSAMLRPKGRQNSLKVLEALEKHVSFSMDIAAVVSEFTPESTTPIFLFRLEGQFKPCHERLDRELSLAASFNRVIRHHANWLKRTDRSLRDQLTQYGSILGAAENVRLQRKIGLLTWVLVAFGLVTLLMTVLTVTQSEWFSDTLSFLSDLLRWFTRK